MMVYGLSSRWTIELCIAGLKKRPEASVIIYVPRNESYNITVIERFKGLDKTSLQTILKDHVEEEEIIIKDPIPYTKGKVLERTLVARISYVGDPEKR